MLNYPQANVRGCHVLRCLFLVLGFCCVLVLAACQGESNPDAGYGASNASDQANVKMDGVTSKFESEARKLRPEFQSILDSAGVAGSIVVYDVNRKMLMSNDFERCTKGYLPASTFKIVNSMIGLETGVLKNQHHLFKWDSLPRRMTTWERDLRLLEAYQVSCVPCYQQLARTIGVERMNLWLDSLGFPGMDVNQSTIDNFWLQGDSRITSFEWLEFMRRIAAAELPLSEETHAEMRDILLLGESNGMQFSGKTGWSIREGFNIGWFVGMLEAGEDTLCIVVNVEPTEKVAPNNFAMVRQKVAMQALRQMGYAL